MSCTPDQHDVVGVEARGGTRVGGQRRYSPRMTKRERAFQVDEVAERDEQRVQRSFVKARAAVGRFT